MISRTRSHAPLPNRHYVTPLCLRPDVKLNVKQQISGCNELQKEMPVTKSKPEMFDSHLFFLMLSAFITTMWTFEQTKEKEEFP